MLFLIEYDRSRGRITTFREFSALEKEKAEESRIELEIDLHRRAIPHEVVLFEATTEEDLRRTHRRYFENLAELLTSPAR